MHKLFAILSTTLVVMALPTQAECPGAALFDAGDYGAVTPGEANNVRNAPATTAELVGQIPGSGVFEVIGETVCDDTFTWIEVRHGEISGWTAQGNATLFVEKLNLVGHSTSYIRFAYPPAFAKEVIAERLPESIDMRGQVPIRQRVSLANDERNLSEARITVMPTANITDDYPRGIDAVTDLRAVLAEERDFSVGVYLQHNVNESPPDIDFPEDPFRAGSRRMLVTQPHYVDTQNGRGVAFVTYYAQDIIPVTNNSISYDFVGLAADERYLVSVRLPVRTEALPDVYSADIFPTGRNDALFNDYIFNTTQQLDALAPDGWEPSLTTLDTIVRSIYIVPNWEKRTD